MAEYRVSISVKITTTVKEWKNHIVYASNRSDVISTIVDYYCGYEIAAIVFDSGIDWSKD